MEELGVTFLVKVCKNQSKNQSLQEPQGSSPLHHATCNTELMVPRGHSKREREGQGKNSERGSIFSRELDLT